MSIPVHLSEPSPSNSLFQVLGTVVGDEEGGGGGGATRDKKRESERKKRED